MKVFYYLWPLLKLNIQLQLHTNFHYFLHFGHWVFLDVSSYSTSGFPSLLNMSHIGGITFLQEFCFNKPVPVVLFLTSHSLRRNNTPLCPVCKSQHKVCIVHFHCLADHPHSEGGDQQTAGSLFDFHRKERCEEKANLLTLSNYICRVFPQENTSVGHI